MPSPVVPNKMPSRSLKAVCQMLFLSTFLSIPKPHSYCHNPSSTYCVANDMTSKLSLMIVLRSNSVAIPFLVVRSFLSDVTLSLKVFDLVEFVEEIMHIV